MKTIKDVEKYAAKVIPLLNLSHWRITFSESEECNGFHAENDLLFNYKRSDIIIRPKFWGISEKKKKEIVIHELLHCHFGFWKLPFNATFDKCRNISVEQYQIPYDNIFNAEEEPVELLSRSIYNLIEK